MAKKKAVNVKSVKGNVKRDAKGKKRSGNVVAVSGGEARVAAKLTEAEEDLQWHMGHGYQLETDSLGGNPVLRMENGEVVRPASANRSTVEALQKRGLIVPAKSGDPLLVVWRKKSTA